MIVLGETIAQVIHSVAASNSALSLAALPILEAGMGLGVGFGLWWVYFDYIARRPTRPVFYVALAWVYLHLVMLMGIVVVGVGVSRALASGATQTVAPDVRALLLLGLAVAILAVTIMETTLHRTPDEPTDARVSFATKFGIGVALVVLEFVLPPTPLVAVLGIQLVALAIPAAYGAVVWYRAPRI